MTALADLLKPVDPSIHPFFSVHFAHTRELLLFSDVIINKLSEMRLGPQDQTQFRRLLLYTFCRTTSIGRGIWLLASAGQTAEAFMLVRAVVEADIQLRYVLKKDASEREQLSKEYFEFLKCRQKKEIEFAENIAKKRDDEESVKTFGQAAAEIDVIADGRKLNSLWPSKHLDELAKDIGYKDHYMTTYNLFSKYTHPSAVSLREFSDPDSGEWSTESDLNGVQVALWVFFEAYLNAVETLAKEFWSEPSEEIQTFRVNLRQMTYISNVLATRIDPH